MLVYDITDATTFENCTHWQGKKLKKIIQSLPTT